MDGQRQRVVVGFLGVLAVLGILLHFVGVDELTRELSNADGTMVTLVVLAIFGWLAAWGFGLQTVLNTLGNEVSFVRSVLIMNGAMFSNNVTPFGQAGGEPVTALLISKTTDAEYERGLAAIATMDSLNFVPSIVIAMIGLGYYATQTTFSRRLQLAAVVVVALTVGVTAGGYLGWQRRSRIQRGIVKLLVTVLNPVLGVLPRVSRFDREAIRSRVDHFLGSIERIATDREGVTVALGAAAAGWAFQMVALWLSFQAVGAPVPFAIVLFAVPVGAMAGVTPLPGGAGGIEAVLVGLISTLPGAVAGLETITAAVVIFRGAVYVIPVVIGGLVMNAASIDYL